MPPEFALSSANPAPSPGKNAVNTRASSPGSVRF